MSRFLILALDRDVTLAGEIRFHPDQTISTPSDPDAVGVIAAIALDPVDVTAMRLDQLLEQHELDRSGQEGVAA